MAVMGDAGVAQVDVLIAGGGMSGLCAAVSALESGARVLVAEKGSRLGGSMWLSNGVIWTFMDKDVLRREVAGNEALQDMVLDNIEQDLVWLTRNGVELGAHRAFQWYGRGRVAAPHQMTHALAAKVEELGGETRRGCSLEDMHRLPEGGFEVELLEGDTRRVVKARCVILATGGFQGNAELLTRYVTKNTQHIYLRANPWSTGDGLTTALALGGAVSAGIDHFYGHALAAPPARFGPMQFLEATQRYGNHALALNLGGQRFVDESGGTGEEALNAAIAQQERATAVYIVDDEIAHMSKEYYLSPPRVSIDRAEAFGAPVIRADSLEALAEALQDWGLPSRITMASIRNFNDAIQSGQADQMMPPRRKNRFPIAKAPFSAVQVRAAITFTCGGIATDTDMRVLKRAGTVSTLPMLMAEPDDVLYGAVPGLFATGNDIGGMSSHGYMGSLCVALVSGRRAGAQAAEEARADEGA